MDQAEASNQQQHRRRRNNLNDNRRGGHVFNRRTNENPDSGEGQANSRRRPRGYRGRNRNGGNAGSNQNWRHMTNPASSHEDQRPPEMSAAPFNRGNGSRGLRNLDNVRLLTAASRMTAEESADPESQRKKWEELLKSGSYECMICCEEVRIKDQIWNCFSSCHNIFHLDCISTWACSEAAAVAPTQSTQLPDGWRCPACQYIYTKHPKRYYCFCGKKRNPDVNERNPHSCGLVCFKKRGKNCPHKCPLFCHPGPCPPCDVGIQEKCSCGKTTLPVNCGSSQRDILSCQSICDKLLSCQRHKCLKTCHPGDCDPCQVVEEKSCFCGKKNRTFPCSQRLPSTAEDTFSCGDICNRQRECGNHRCKDVCHPGACSLCPLLPSLVQTCPCGKKPISSFAYQRTSCKDRLPSCSSPCEKTLGCGPMDGLHKCDKKCHNGPCGPCKLSTPLKCRCGRISEIIPCRELPPDRVYICNRFCNRKLSCGRHKCTNACCPKDDNHVCVTICNKQLNCKLHKCSEVCHPGACQSCFVGVSWQELTCYCGQTVVYPPVPCGTPIPTCNRRCSRVHPCNHPIDHTCHSGEACPPCTQPTTKTCFGGHTSVNNVLCCRSGATCGKPCKKMMSCGKHECQRACHEGSCGKCTYPCGQKLGCGHFCTQICHGDKRCQDSACKVMVPVHCPCRRLVEKKPCFDVMSRTTIPVTLMAKLRIQSDQEMDVTDLLKKAEEDKFCKLECDERCLQIERNRALADALDIKDADVTPDKAATYSESLKQAYMHYPDFVKDTYTTLEKLVKECDKKPFAVHNFPPMRQDLRQIVHELAEVFVEKSHSIDQEPARSVVVKAQRGKSAVPPVSIMDFMKDRVLTMKAKSTTSTGPSKEAAKQTQLTKPSIDYFDFMG